MSGQAISLGVLGERLAQYRLNQNITQAELAHKAGVSERTIQRLEQGQSIQLAGFVRILHELGMSDRLNALIPPPIPSPIEQLKLQGKQRKRASRSKQEGASDSLWSWEDD